MIRKYRGRVTAAVLAAALALATPAMASDEILTGTADLQPEILIGGTAEQNLSAADAEMEILTGTSDETADFDRVAQAYLDVLTYIQTNLTNPVVDSIGGEWSVIALERNGMLGDDVQNTYLKNLLDTLEAKKGVLSKVKSTEFSRVILALTSIGMNPASIGGYDLIQNFAEFDRIPFQGINGPVYALIALDSHDYEIPPLSGTQKGTQTTRDVLISYILEHQLAGGAWGLNEDLDIPDDMTPMTIQALAPYYDRSDVKAAVDKALAIWSRRQTDNGGFAQAEGIETGSETVSQTIIALCTLDVKLMQDPMFVKNGHSLMDALLADQTPSGAFAHTTGGEEDAMASDQAALALTAYVRAQNGQTSLYDMTDVPLMEDKTEPEENIQAFREKLDKIPANPTLKYKESIFSMLAELGQMGDFAEKQEMTDRLNALKEEINRQQAKVDELDQAIWDGINPSKITLEDKPTVEKIREQYNAMHRENRAFLTRAEDLFYAEAALLDLENETLILRGTQPGGKPAIPQPGQKPGNGVITVVESNTVHAKVGNGVVAAGEFEKVKGQERNLRMEGTLTGGRTYTLTIYGKDITAAQDMRIGIQEDSVYREEMNLLAKEDLAIFSFEQSGKFPGIIQVELPASLEDGQYLLLSYNPVTGKAEFCQKAAVENGIATFLADQGGDYFLTKKASSHSVEEIRKDLAEKAEPTEAPAETAEPETTEAPVPETTAAAVPEEIPAGESVNVWMIVAVIAIAVAAVLAGVVSWMKKDKVKK